MHNPQFYECCKRPHYCRFLIGIQQSLDSPHMEPIMRTFEIFCDINLNKLLNKQSWSCDWRCHDVHIWCHCIGSDQIVLNMNKPPYDLASLKRYNYHVSNSKKSKTIANPYFYFLFFVVSPYFHSNSTSKPPLYWSTPFPTRHSNVVCNISRQVEIHHYNCQWPNCKTRKSLTKHASLRAGTVRYE